ncbi:uncharacterized protein ACR2FA_001304, partial [Aphomia sociella]
FPERLYLSKPDVYVDNYSLLQHQVDGIRFLYRQYVKKNPGVIISEPAECVNSLQVALFINAFIQFLKKPVLILCNESDVDVWAEHFKDKAQCFNDIAVKESNPFLKKKIFINSTDILGSFHRCDWSIIVVDDDSFLKNNQVRSQYKADYKIWLTTTDVKDNLQSFSLIYKWFYPKEKFNIEEWKVNKGNISDMLTKTIRLEAFLEDIVLRRTNIVIPPKSVQEQPANRVRRGNKDATGTKIKRSRKLDDDNTDRHTVNKKSCASMSLVASNHNSNINSDNNRVEHNNDEVKVSVACDVIDKSNKDAVNTVTSNNRESLKSHEYKDNIEEFHNVPQIEESVYIKLDKTNEEVVPMEIELSSIAQDCATDDIHLNYSEENISQDNNDKKKELSVTETSMEIDHNTENRTNIEGLSTEHKVDKEGDISLNNKVHNKTNSCNRSIDYKLNELEEKTFKKFKGSLLDRMF